MNHLLVNRHTQARRSERVILESENFGKPSSSATSVDGETVVPELSRHLLKTVHWKLTEQEEDL